MDYLLLWVESLAAALLVFALLGSLLERALPRRLVLGSLFLSKVLGASFLTALCVYARRFHITPDWTVYFALWAVSFALLAIVLWRRGFNHEGSARRGLGLAALVAVALLLATVASVSAAVDRSLLAALLQQEALAASLVQGSVPDDENAALAFKTAFEQLDALAPQFPSSYKTCGAPCGGESADPLGAERIRQGTQGVLALLRKAASMPRYSFIAFDSARPWASRTPSLLGYRRAANLLALDARARSRKGDTSGAAADLVAIYLTARHLQADHTFLAHLLSLGLERNGTDAVEFCLAATPGWRSEDLASLAAAVPGSFPESFVRSLRLEESAFLISLASWGLGTEASSAWSAENLPVSNPAARTLLKIFMVPEDIKSYSEWSQKAIYLSESEVEAFAQEVASAPKGLATTLTMPNMARSWVTTLTEETRSRLARFGLATASYHAKNNRWPTTADDMVPAFLEAVPADPFGGQPLVLLAQDGGIVLASRGSTFLPEGKTERTPIEFRLGGAYEKQHTAK